MSKSISVTLAYKNTDFTRKYKFDDLDDNYSVANFKTRAQAFNASLSGGTGGNVEKFFVSEDYNSVTHDGELASITSAQFDNVTTTLINLN